MIRSTTSLIALGVSLAATSLAIATGGMALTVTHEDDYEGPEDGPIFQGGCYAGGANYEFEDCEDLAVDALGLILSGSFILVDDDDNPDGSVDPDGASLLADLGPGQPAIMGFDAAALGSLPLDVGFMLTDSDGVPNVSFDVTVRDGKGNVATWTISGFGDDDDDGEDDDDDRFVSIFAPNGVAEIILEGLTPIGIDHIQYSTGVAPAHKRGDFDRNGTGDLLIHVPGSDISAWLLDDTDETESDCDDDDDDGDDDDDDDDSDDELSEDWVLVGAGDFDNDCDTDLLWRKGSKLRVWLMEDGKPDDKEDIDDALSSGWSVLAVDDFDGNGTCDILVSKSSSEKLRIWSLNCSDGDVEIASNKAISAESFKPSKHQLITTGDINGDGCADLIWRRNSDGDLRGWAMSGHTIQSSKLIKDNYNKNWEALGGGDVNGDGVIDLVFRSKSSGNVRLCKLRDDFKIDGESTYEGPSNSEMVACTDIDGNGCDDIVWRKKSSSGKLTRWGMDDDGPTNSKTIGYVGNNAVRVHGKK